MTLFEIDQAAVDKVTHELDPQSREVVDYLWAHGHATINELADLIGAPTHMDILLKIRGIINPTAERVIGGALLVFHRRQVDWANGEPVLFSWWVAASPRVEEGARAALPLDLFDDGDRVLVVADLRGVREDDIALEVSENRLIVSVEGLAERLRGEVALPAQVDTGTLTRTYTNGVLAVALQKTPAGTAAAPNAQRCP